MTDEQIMQGLKWCYQVEGSCGDCPYRPDDIKKARCHDRLGNDVIRLIERQQAEIEELKETIKKYSRALLSNRRSIKDDYEYLKRVRAEAIKEFAERLKERIFKPWYFLAQIKFINEDIDDLVKEMGCGKQ